MLQFCDFISFFSSPIIRYVYVSIFMHKFDE